MLLTFSDLDKENFINIFLDTFKSEPFNYEWLSYNNISRYIDDLYNTPCFIGFKYILENETVGFCVGVESDYFLGSTYEIKEILVSKKHQNIGIGKKMLTEIEAYIKQNGTELITLATSKNIVAYNFYKKNGFVVSSHSVFLSKALY